MFDALHAVYRKICEVEPEPFFKIALCLFGPLLACQGVDLESGRSEVQFPLAPRFCLESSHTGDLKIGTPVATLPGSWRYRVSAGTGQPGVSIL